MNTLRRTTTPNGAPQPAEHLRPVPHRTLDRQTPALLQATPGAEQPQMGGPPMTCTIFHSTELPEGRGAQVTGSLPKKPVRWAIEYLIKTPDGRTLLESTKTIQSATFTELNAIMDATIDALGNEAGGIATFVSWRASAHGGIKKKKGGKR